MSMTFGVVLTERFIRYVKKKVGRVRYEARSRGRSSPDSFLSPRNAQTIEPTNAWSTVSSPSANTKYSIFYS